MKNTIEERFVILLESKMKEEGHGFWGKLEEKTGVTSQRWRKAYSRLQRPTSDMLEKVFKEWPDHAFWLATGITDFDYGHRSPDDVSILKDLKNNATNEFFLEEIKSSNEKITKIMTKGLKVLASLDLIDSDQVPATNNASFYQTVRWIEIFLDRYLLRVPIDAAIEIFNQLRVKVNSLSNTEIDDQQQQLIASLDLKFSIKKEELERLRNQINLVQDKRIATYDHQAT